MNETSKSAPRNKVVWGCGAAVVLWVTFVAIVIASLTSRFVRTSSVSPDGRWALHVSEPKISFIDRNFRVTLTNQLSGQSRMIFRSADQSTTIKWEKIVWSADSRYAALVGDRYFVVPDSTLPNGSIVFLLMDTETDEVFCNSDQPTTTNPIPIEKAIELVPELGNHGR